MLNTKVFRGVGQSLWDDNENENCRLGFILQPNLRGISIFKGAFKIIKYSLQL